MSSNRNMRKPALCMAIGLCLASMAPCAGVRAERHRCGRRPRRPPGPSHGHQPRDRFNPHGDGRCRRQLPLPLPARRLHPAVGSDGQAATGCRQRGAGRHHHGEPGGAGAATSRGQVVGSRVINRSTCVPRKSATNITREEIARLPVDQNLGSVALLAPGVVKGARQFGGITFGGSSVAENSYYINGLNVTDLYSRHGFSEAPFDFYQEFQVKTGGYSVEFGRTTGGVDQRRDPFGQQRVQVGAELTLEPRALAGVREGSVLQRRRYPSLIAQSRRQLARPRLDVWASGALDQGSPVLLRDVRGARLQAEQYRRRRRGLTPGRFRRRFWGGTLDWNITDSNS